MSKKITSMTLENFLSFREASFDFEGAGFVLVEGDNGAGKSAMIDGIVWCLHGTTLRGYEKDEVVNRRAGEGCVVKVTLTDGDEMYTVTRARRHPKLKDSLTVTHDNFGEDMSKAGVKETQEVVDRLLGCSRKTFLSSVVFGQDRAYRFSSLTDGEQKKILDEVIGVERFAQACASARTRVSGVQGDLVAGRRNLEKAEAAAELADVEAVDMQVKHLDFEGARRGKIEAERAKLRAVKEQLGKARKAADVKALKAATDVALKALASQEKKFDEAVEADASARARAAAAKAKRDAAEVDLKRRKKPAGDCPTCGQKVSKETQVRVVRALGRELSALETELSDTAGIADDVAAALADEKQRLKELRDVVAAAQKALNDGVSAEANAATLRRRAADHEERIAELEGDTSPYAELAEKARARHASHQGDAAFWRDECAAMEEKIRLAQFWVKAFGASGLRSLLVDSSLPLLNEEAARVSRALTGGAIAVEFSAQSEQKSGKVVDRFEVKVDNKHGAGDYQGNSAGERAKVDLCVGLALQRLVASRSSASFNVAFFDEVFDHLDSSAHERVVEVLSEIDKESVFVVSHDDGLKAWFPSTLRMVKRGGFSVVEE